MELLAATRAILTALHVPSVAALSDAITGHIQAGTADMVINAFLQLEPGTDWIQAIYEYNLAERKEKKQDYTPASLAALVTAMIAAPPATVYDVCCGSGALTLAVAAKYPHAKYILHELDATVVPFTLVNLAMHNLDAVLINGDVITGHASHIYRLTPGKTHSAIEEIDSYTVGTYDVCVSNPPFNLKGPTKGISGNDYFLQYCKDHATKQALLIMYKYDDTATFRACIDDGTLRRIVYNPPRMFTATPTETCVIDLKHTPPPTSYLDYRGSVIIQDARQYYIDYIRDQNGQYGGKSHTMRTYHKLFRAYNDDIISNIVNIWHGPETYEIPRSVLLQQVPGKYGLQGEYRIYKIYPTSDIVQEHLDAEEKAKQEKYQQRYADSLAELKRVYNEFRDRGFQLIVENGEFHIYKDVGKI